MMQSIFKKSLVSGKARWASPSLLLLALTSLTACVSMPTGPSMMALPGTGKNFEEFRYDDYLCRQFAYHKVGGNTPSRASMSSGVGSAAVGAGVGAAAGAALGGGRGAAIGAGTGAVAGSLAGIGTAAASGSISQERYDAAYVQCMYAKGHQVPVYGQVTNSYSGGRYTSPPYPPYSSSYPPAPRVPQGTVRVPPPPPGVPPPPPPGKILRSVQPPGR